MDSPRSGSLNEPQILLQIESDLFDLYIEGKPTHPIVESLGLHQEEDGQKTRAHLQVDALSTQLQLTPDQIKVFHPDKPDLVPYDPDNIYPCFYEHQTYELVIEKKPDGILPEFHHDNYHLRKSIKPKGKNLLSGNLNFQNEVGYTEFELRIHGEAVLRIALEVFPSKIDYRRDYQNLLAEVNGQVYNLAFDFLRKTYNLTGLTEERKQDQSLAEFFAILRTVLRQLVQAVERIHKTPHHRLAKENRVVVADRVKRAGRENVAYLAKRPHLMREDNEHGMIRAGGKSYRPTHVLETRRRIEYDTAENRFVRWALLRIEGKLKEMRKRLLEGIKWWHTERDKQAVNAQVEQIDGMRGQVARLLRLDFLQEVGEMKQLSVTLVLQMAPGYRDVYRHYLLLLKGLTLQGDLYRLSMKDVAQLYEYWCFLKIHSLLQDKYELVRQDIIRVVRGGLFVRLDKSAQASVTYLNPDTKEEFTLMYNSKRETPTARQEPDNVLSLKKRDRRKRDLEVTYNYVFDAKYKLNADATGPQEEDINTMHRYRDAIVSQEQGTERYERSMYGAYVLFPYQERGGEFEEHRFYQSIKKINVGALPFLPGSTRLVEAFLDELISDSPEKAFERSVQPRGSKRYYADRLSRGNVLIGSLSSEEQLDVCLAHKFYHMPLRKLPEQQVLTQLERIGIYQSKKKFGEQEAGIRYVGRIKSWRIIPRREITEIASKQGKVNELYIRFEIEEWEPLAHVILPSGNGVRYCLLTSTYLLERAGTLAELRLDLDVHLQAEWREQRRRGEVQVTLASEDDYVDAEDNRIQAITVEPPRSPFS